MTPDFALPHLNFPTNTTVLLREHKRHTVRRVASVRSAALSGGGGTPSWPGWGGGVPIITWPGGYPQDWSTSWKGLGTSDLGPGYPLQKGPGKEHGTGVPRKKDLAKNLGLGYPPHPGGVQTENITFPILRIRAVKIT